MKVVLTGNTIETNLTDTRPTSHYTLLLALLCGAVAVLITIGNNHFLLLCNNIKWQFFVLGVLITLRLAKSSAQRSPDHNIPHTNGNGLHHEGIDLIALSSNIPPASEAHLDTKVSLDCC